MFVSASTEFGESLASVYYIERLEFRDSQPRNR